MTRKTSHVLGAASILICSAAVSAFSFTSQNRSVHAYVNYGGGNVTESAPNFDFWDHTVYADSGTFGGAASARQISSLSADRVAIDSILGAAKPTAAGTGVATARSSLEVTFNISHAINYELFGNMFPGPNYPEPYDARPRLVTLAGPSANVFLSGAWSNNGTTPPTLTGNGDFNVQGTLVPGDYTFTVIGESSDNAGPAGSGAEILPGFVATLDFLSLPGDFDLDFDLDASDIDQLFATPSGPVSPDFFLFDLNQDGSIISSPNVIGSDADYWVRELSSTEYGDVNFDRKVDFNDLLIVAQNYESTTGGWSRGDFNGADGVNFNDLLLIAQEYGFGTSNLNSSSFGHDWALAQTNIPEPTSLLVAMSGIVLLRRRR